VITIKESLAEMAHPIGVEPMTSASGVYGHETGLNWGKLQKPVLLGMTRPAGRF